MTALRLGSLCTGFGALDQAATDVLGDVELAFVADPGSKLDKDRWDDGPVKLLAHRHPDVPNLGDISAVDWTRVEPVDILTAGFPCQDISVAGKQAGLMPGSRSGVWASVAAAIGTLRPSLVLIENVGGLLSARAHSDLEHCPFCLGDEPGGAGRIILRALGCVLGDLADLGFDAQWCSVRASDVGAPHRRNRVFVVAWPADTAGDTGRLVHRNLRAVPDADGRGRRPDLDEVQAWQSDADRCSDGRNGLILLPTPTASEATGAGHAAHGNRNLRTEVALLPTPMARDGKGAGPSDLSRKSPNLNAVSGLLPTPDATRRGAVTPESAAARRDNPDRTLNLEDAVALLPTPRASDGAHGGPNQRGSSGDLMLPSAVMLLPTPTVAHDARNATANRANPKPTTQTNGWTLNDVVYADRWGEYGPAIERWEHVIGRTAPEPTAPSRNGNPQLNAAFVEWLMGCAEGWVCDVPGLTRNQKLRLLGNGVVRRQGAYAFRQLLGAAGFTDSRSAA